MYTGSKGEEGSKENVLKKTTLVVKELLEPYMGTYRSVKTDRFYTSVELCKRIRKK